MLAELVELETRVLESNWMLASLQIRHHWCRLQQAVIHSTKIAISSFGGLAVTPSEPYCCEMRWWRSLNLVLFSLFWSKHEVLLSLVFFCFFFPECTAPLPVCNARSTKHLPLKSHLWRRCHSVSSACCYSANIPSWCLFGLLSGGWVKANFKFLVASSARAAPRPSTTSPPMSIHPRQATFGLSRHLWSVWKAQYTDFDSRPSEGFIHEWVPIHPYERAEPVRGADGDGQNSGAGARNTPKAKWHDRKVGYLSEQEALPAVVPLWSVSSKQEYLLILHLSVPSWWSSRCVSFELWGGVFDTRLMFW